MFWCSSVSLNGLNDEGCLLLSFLLNQTVEIKVKMDCDGCERRVKNAVKDMKGKTTCIALFFFFFFLFFSIFPRKTCLASAAFEF